MKMKNLSKKLLLVLIMVTLAACAKPISKKAEQDLAAPVNCATAQADIKVLESEKARAGKMILDGVTAIVPVGAVVGIVTLTEGEKLEVGTGIYNHKITEKIAEIKKECNLN